MIDDDVHSLILLALAAVGTVWYAVLWSIWLLGCFAARKRYRLRPRSPSTSSLSAPGVSILRPLKGLDTNLYENLETTFNQDYLNYELIFCVAAENDQALLIVHSLILKYPDVAARIIIGEEIVGVNPKVNNLVRAFREAKNDILWVLDSNVSVERGTLARSVDALTIPRPGDKGKRVAVVHHVPFAFSTEFHIGSKIEEAFLNTNHAKMYIAINTVAVESCVVGKSNLYHRSDVERINGSFKPLLPNTPVDPTTHGLHVFGKYMAEDNMIASALWHELDVRHELSCDVARNAVGNMSLYDYIQRRIRWIRVRKHMVMLATILEPFTESVLLSVIGCISFKHLFGVPPLFMFLLHFPLCLAVDLDVYASLAGHPLPSGERFQFIAAWAARELLTLPIYCVAIFGSTVTWRGTRYQMLRNGEVKKAAPGRGQRWFSWLHRLTGAGKGAYRPLTDSENFDT